MNQSNVRFLDLPNEILIMILKKLDNINVLYSLLDVDNQRLDMIVQGKTFTETLNFVSTTSLDDIVSIADSMLDRFCINILPRIGHNIKSLILESESIERILLTADYPNLTELKLLNFKDQIASCYFTDQSPFRRIFQQQITDLILVYKSDINILLERQYQNGVHEYILKFFENLKHLSITGSASILTLHNSSLTACSSSILYKLCVFVNNFEECLALLDGRLKQLTTFIVIINYPANDSTVVYNMDDLPNLKCFSLTCFCLNNEYDTQILPFFRRMSNLEELTLDIMNADRNTFVDGTQINNKILVHMPRLNKFTFHICTKTELHHLVHYLSSDDIQRTFTNIGYQHVDCILYYTAGRAICHVFSLPFVFDHLEYIGNTFSPIVFIHVISLTVHDRAPFKHEFFVRIARFFPLLKKLHIFNFKSQTEISDKLNSLDHELCSIVEYPYLISLSLFMSHIDYVEQFLNETKTLLPRLTQLKVDYDKLTIVTENFTRDITRLNCAKVKKIIIPETLVHSKDFYVYFPLL
ncbi:unnamed protein product [Rotaria sp. Silwood2]|nr:unnamed protein product [Rotaria sp. Silwood2]CAF2477006.1 unnamed protein product [Rotaria sp. Silwood2]CAF3928873.1 unnamed protein product [Rotaria sp. Silwood2]CAF3950011.1 unnamed protein product [Rotaria sp. Silwood2]CAF4298937.1 unnamed protein product [Rotaria sp. Silwood2]